MSLDWLKIQSAFYGTNTSFTLSQSSVKLILCLLESYALDDGLWTVGDDAPTDTEFDDIYALVDGTIDALMAGEAPSPPSPSVWITHDIGDLSEYTSTTGAILVVAPGLNGTSHKLRITYSTTPAYGEKTIVLSSSRYKVSLRIDINLLSMANNDSFDAFRLFTGIVTNVLFRVRKTGSIYEVRATVGLDDLGNTNTLYYTIPSTETLLEFEVSYAASAVSNDGTATLSIDGTQKQVLAGLDIFDIALPGTLRAGAISNLDASTSGDFFMDDIQIVEF
jgi:hypothetical protein